MLLDEPAAYFVLGWLLVLGLWMIDSPAPFFADPLINIIASMLIGAFCAPLLIPPLALIRYLID